MPSIRELVAQFEANRAEAFSVVGGSAVNMTIAGAAQEGPTMSEAQINAIVESDLNQDQQTDIMVGRPVGFSLEVDGATWRVLVQPMPTGLALRGTREAQPLASPTVPDQSVVPAQPAVPEPPAVGTVPDSFGMGVPLDDDDDAPISLEDVDNPPTPPPGSLDAFDVRGVPQPVEELHTPPPAAIDAFDTTAGTSFASPDLLAQDDGFGMMEAPVLTPEERETTLFEAPAVEAPSGVESTLLQSGGAVQAPPPDPTDPGDQIGGTDGTILMQHAPRVHPDPAPVPEPAPLALADDPGDILLADSRAAHPVDEETPTTQMPRAQGAPTRRKSRSPSSGTLMAMRPPGLGGGQNAAGGPRPRSPSRSVPRVPTGQFERSDELEASALCFCRDLTEAFEAGGRIGMGVEVIGEDDIHDGRAPTVEDLGIESGATLIVNIDDPSRLLGWVLLRREEGFRVFVVTRATGPAGARRILLGVHATMRAEEWLDEHPVFALVGGTYQPI